MGSLYVDKAESIFARGTWPTWPSPHASPSAARFGLCLFRVCHTSPPTWRHVMIMITREFVIPPRTPSFMFLLWGS